MAIADSVTTTCLSCHSPWLGHDSTERARCIAHHVAEITLATGAPPTIREIADAYGYATPGGVVAYLSRAHAEGWLDHQPRQTRAYRAPAPARARIGRRGHE